MARIARLSDVAQRSGVSVATVSRHLNGKIQLPAATVARIESAITALGYQPNPHARSLSLGRSETIGLVIPDIANPYFARLAAAVERAARRHGLGVLLCATLNEGEREHEYLRRLGRNHLDGLIFGTNHPSDGSLAAEINKANRRVVIIDEDVEGAHGSKIFCDNEQGGYLAGRHLLAEGHRRIAFFGGPEFLMSTRERIAGCRRAMEEGSPDAVFAHLMFGDYSLEHGRRAAERLLEARDGTTAVLISSDEIAIGALDVFRDAGVKIPQQLSVVGFDDIAPFHLFDPPLTCIRQPVDEMGRRAVELLVSGMAGARMKTAVECLPVELMVRGSVAPPYTRASASRHISRA